MRIRDVLCVAVLLSCLQACGRDREAGPQGDEHRGDPPNVLLISLDTLAADHLGCYGYDRDTTPFLDELAARGVRFSNSFINCHPTPPSHATILSSQYQETHQLFTYADELEKGMIRKISGDVTMVQEILGAHGYTTWAITGGGFTGGRIGFSRGFDVFDDGQWRLRGGTGIGFGPGLGFHPLLDLIDERSSDVGPIFAFLHTYQIHAPYLPPQRYRTLFSSGEREADSFPRPETVHRDMSQLTREDLEVIRERYDGNIRFTDDQLRSFFSELEETGFLSNAVIIVTSDHGEEFGEHGGLLHGAGKLYDELLRVPLIIAGTGVREGLVVDRLVSSIDIAPTILAVAGIETDVPMQGRNLLAPSAVPAEEEVVFSQWGPSYYSVRTRDWKLIANNRGESPRKPRRDAPRFELYDLRSDPREQRNLAERFPDRVERMEKILDSWMAGIDRKPEPGAPITLSEETLRQLKGLGYVE